MVLRKTALGDFLLKLTKKIAAEIEYDVQLCLLRVSKSMQSDAPQGNFQ